jgi:amino acid transporter
MPRFGSREEYENWKAGRLNHRKGSDLRDSYLKRPFLVLAIGWVFIVISCLVVLGGISMALQAAFIQQSGLDPGEMGQIPRDMPVLFELLLFVMKNVMVLSIILTGIGIFALISGFYFLKQRRWARTVLEIISWISAVFITSVGLLWIGFWISGPDSPAHFSMFGITIGIFIMLVYTAVPVTAIVLLRHNSVKGAFYRG